MIDSIFSLLDANGFNIFMIGWLTALVGGIMHAVGGGFKDGRSKVPVLGNFEAVKAGEKGFTQQRIGGFIFMAGALAVIIGGLFYYT